MDEELPLKRPFKQHESVLVYDGPILYEANVLQVLCDEGTNETRHYLVHFIGWNRCYDDVVPESALLPRTPANMALAERLYEKLGQKRAADDDVGVAARNGTLAQAHSQDEATLLTSTASTASVSKDEKEISHCRGLETVLLQVDESDPLRWFELPELLKRTVLDDFEFVSEGGQLYELPSRVSVSTILHAWARHRGRLQEADAEVAQKRAFADSLQGYFDAALGRMLLYENEQAQYRRLTASQGNKAASELYGGEHLLRLLVKLPWFLEHASVTERELQELSLLFQDLCRFLLRNGRKYFRVEDDHALETTGG
ncbi:hypothetical protein CCYA_CCYA14G3671 [Cyanidiococcus yangmingshanensis]|nr:hypothetical protein CCYA_CCYA14G3671 [Cyanidiococcus yangmingshanensis]